MKDQESESSKTTVSLVLGSGGARGLAHIGVIRLLKEKNFEIKSISGCSIGSLIGGVYAAGKLDLLESWMLSITKKDIANLLDISWGNGGLFKGDRVINTLIEMLDDVLIEDLPIPYTAVAADIITEKEVWINSGLLFDAIRASVSLPLFFTPVRKNGAVLIDGGVLNPVPIAPTFNDNTDLTISVNLGGEMIKTNSTNSSTAASSKKGDFESEVKRFITTLSTNTLAKNERNLGMYDVADKAFDTMQGTIARLKIASYPPDVDIEIARNACGTLEFDRAAEMIQLGYEKAALAYDQYQERND